MTAILILVMIMCVGDGPKTEHTLKHEYMSYEMYGMYFEFINSWNIVRTTEKSRTPYTRNWKRI